MRMNCYQILGITPPVSMDEVKVAYRKAAALHHPDRGGSHQGMVVVNDAYQQAKWEVERGGMRKDYSQPQPVDPTSVWIEDVDELLDQQQQNGYKKAWVMFQLLDSETRPPLEAWKYLAGKMGYKNGWAWYKYNEWREE